jgi:hypothetical protein
MKLFSVRQTKLRRFVPGMVCLGVAAAFLLSWELKATLRDVRMSFFSMEATRAAVRSSLYAAYCYGQGSESYGLENPRPARFKRAWACHAEKLASFIVKQPWFGAYRSAMDAFGHDGMPGFLIAYDKAILRSDVFRNSAVFSRFVREEHIDDSTPEGHREAVTRFFMSMGYDSRLNAPFIALNRLLIANFICPAEARGVRDSLGMDKLTHFYYARGRAEEYGVIVTTALGLAVELGEFFAGHHHWNLFLRTISHWDNFKIVWAGGWPRLYPSPAFYEKVKPKLEAQNKTWVEWKAQASLKPFGWGDLAANWLGLMSSTPTAADAAIVLGLIGFPLGLILLVKHRRRKEPAVKP